VFGDVANCFKVFSLFCLAGHEWHIAWTYSGLLVHHSVRSHIEGLCSFDLLEVFILPFFQSKSERNIFLNKAVYHFELGQVYLV